MDANLSREAVMMAHVRDPESAYYQALCNMLRDVTAQEKAAKRAKVGVELPFVVDERDLVSLEQQFSVSIRTHGAAMRIRAEPRMSAMIFCTEEVLLDYAGGPGRVVLQLDGDLVSAAVRGVEGRVIERTGATARLCTGYGLEYALLQQMAVGGDKPMNVRARLLQREVLNGAAEHFSADVRVDGPRVDVITVNHFKTPAGPHQLAWLAKCRGAPVVGAFPFQPDMLERTSGELRCCPGKYYIDEEADRLVLVPTADATMSISHPWRALRDLATSNTVTVAGNEFLCERYFAVAGIMFYTIKPVDMDYEAPEILRSYYYSPDDAALVEITYPKVRFSDGGVPVGWGRGKLRMLNSRYQKVLARVAASNSPVVTVAEVYVALADYNNLVVNTLDTAVAADRMDVEVQQDAALAIALHVNYRRHAARGTLNCLLSAVKTRYAAAGKNVARLAWAAMAAWLRRPNVKDIGEITDVSSPRLLDWCGNDFGVVVAEVDPWVEITQIAGERSSGGGVFYHHLPKPPVEVRQFRPSRTAVGWRPGLLPTSSEPTVVKPLVDCTQVEGTMGNVVYDDMRKGLLDKMVREQDATVEVPQPVRRLAVESHTSVGVGLCPVPLVEPVSAIGADIRMVNRGYFQRDAVTTGYRLAEVDVDKYTQGNIAINDQKRLIPKPRWVRRPVVDAGVEGARVPSSAALLGAVFKRNIGIPNNRTTVDLDKVPELAVDAVLAACFREDWQEVLASHLASGLWKPNDVDVQDYLAGLEPAKARAMLDEFFMPGDINLESWLLMAKGKVKPSREEGSQNKVDHGQTIMFLDSKSTCAMYSSMTRRLLKCFNECLRPNVRMNAQESPAEHEEWYNSTEALRRSFPATYTYTSDIRCYDRAQEHPALRAEMAFYRRMGLNAETLAVWERELGPKRAMSMMFGIVFGMVLGGVSGDWKTLWRNGLVNLLGSVTSAKLTYRDIVMMDVKGDDIDLETSRAVDTVATSECLSSMFNMSAKFYHVDVRYMCKEFRVKVCGRWYFLPDPWARVQSLCTPLWVGNGNDSLAERWQSLVADLRHYDNGILVDAAIAAARVHYGIPDAFAGMARGLAAVRADRNLFFKMFKAPEVVS